MGEYTKSVDTDLLHARVDLPTGGGRGMAPSPLLTRPQGVMYASQSTSLSPGSTVELSFDSECRGRDRRNRGDDECPCGLERIVLPFTVETRCAQAQLAIKMLPS